MPQPRASGLGTSATLQNFAPVARNAARQLAPSTLEAFRHCLAIHDDVGFDEAAARGLTSATKGGDASVHAIVAATIRRASRTTSGPNPTNRASRFLASASKRIVRQGETPTKMP